jgi:hypothetical protein
LFDKKHRKKKDGVLVPKDIPQEANAATFNLLPQKSKDIKHFFRSWMKNINVNVVTEEVVVAYFNGLLNRKIRCLFPVVYIFDA